jgi:hypothetical protein
MTCNKIDMQYNARNDMQTTHASRHNERADHSSVYYFDSQNREWAVWTRTATRRENIGRRPSYMQRVSSNSESRVRFWERE